MPQIEVPKESHGKPRLVAAGAVLVLLLLVGGILVWKLWPQKPPIPKTDDVIKQARSQSFFGRYDLAISIMNQQLTQKISDADKVKLYLEIGADYLNKKDPASAEAEFKKAGALETGYGINDSIASAAMAAGDKATALDYYQRDLKMINDGTAKQHLGDKQSVEDAIKQLGGTP
jgi:tetratricopeptide (TPR) repeat protein